MQRQYQQTLLVHVFLHCLHDYREKGDKGILLQQQIREREGKQPEAVQENSPSHVDHTEMRARDQSTSKL